MVVLIYHHLKRFSGDYMNLLLKEFELVVTLKSEIFRVNLNFLDINNLEQIQELAIDLEIDNYLTYYDLESIYNSEYDKIENIYNQWCEDIIKIFKKLEKELTEKLNG